MNLILCGLPGSGKSTTSQLLAKRLGKQCLETDRLLENLYVQQTKEKASCREIQQKIGEGPFRQLENKVLASLPGENCVVDLGGGTLTKAENAQIIKRLGRLIYLKVDREVVFHRLMAKGTPSYLDPERPFETFLALAESREPLYQKYADSTIEATLLTPQERVDAILQEKGIRSWD